MADRSLEITIFFRPFIKSCLPLLLLLATGCQAPTNKSEVSPNRGPKTVFVANEPIRYFVERISGRGIASQELRILVPEVGDGSPSEWQPSSGEISRIQEADLILLPGAGYSGWTAFVALPASRVVSLSDAFAERLIPLEDAFVHRHGPQGEINHKKKAVFTWLDLDLARMQARTLMEALVELLPDHREELESNHRELSLELQQLDQQYHQVGQALEGQALVAVQPLYQYLADRYGLDIAGVPLDLSQPWTHERQQEVALVLSRKKAVCLMGAKDLSGEERKKVRQSFALPYIRLKAADSLAADDGDWMDQIRDNLRQLESIVP
ncbi:MAG: metal ABC transporter substrate-binding protein [Planctomycetota bacterium]|nr:metal ABC transporter substrate-binding protein [Planctomycetota bacterium]